MCVRERGRERDIFFFHSFVDRCLGHFYALAIVNCAAIDIGLNLCF